MPEASIPGTSPNPASAPVDNLSANPPPADPPPADPYAAFKGTKHKYRANGKDVEVDYEKLLERASKADGAETKFEEAARIRKQIDDKISRLKDTDADNFEELIELVGFEKAQKFARRLVRDEMEWEELSESERRAIIAERRAEEATAKLSEREKAEAATIRAREEAQAFDWVDREVGEAIAEAKAQGVPVHDLPELTELVVDEMLAYLEWEDGEIKAGRPIRSRPPSPRDVIKKLQERYDSRSENYLRKLGVDQLRAKLSKEQLKALRQIDLQELQAPIPRGGRTSAPREGIIDPFAEGKERPKSSRKMKSDDWFKKMDETLGGR